MVFERFLHFLTVIESIAVKLYSFGWPYSLGSNIAKDIDSVDWIMADAILEDHKGFMFNFYYLHKLFAVISMLSMKLFPNQCPRVNHDSAKQMA